MNAQFRHDFFKSPMILIPMTGNRLPTTTTPSVFADTQSERDSFVIANWVHTVSPKMLFEVAPFYHFNEASYDSSPTDFPVATTWGQASNYAGAQADFRADVGPNNFSTGLYAFYQHEKTDSA